jgi:hypothetical protein
MVVATAVLLAGCGKHECESSTPGVAEGQGSAKIPNVFVHASNGGQAVPNLQLNVHCGPTLTTNASANLMFGGACTQISQLAAGNYCFERNTYYFLKPTGNSTSRMFLRFKFDNTFDPAALTSALVRYEPNSYTWTVPNQVPGFEYAIYDTRKNLPFCSGGIIRQ